MQRYPKGRFETALDYFPKFMCCLFLVSTWGSHGEVFGEQRPGVRKMVVFARVTDFCRPSSFCFQSQRLQNLGRNFFVNAIYGGKNASVTRLQCLHNFFSVGQDFCDVGKKIRRASSP